ncbi:MAG: response regulator [Caulobacteraceae bacterium]
MLGHGVVVHLVDRLMAPKSIKNITLQYYTLMVKLNSYGTRRWINRSLNNGGDGLASRTPSKTKEQTMEKPMILLVEDEPLIVSFLEEALREGGFAVTVAEASAEAQAALMSGVEFQGLLTDIYLPGPLSGWDLARMARTKFPEIAVVYATGHGELDWSAEGVPGSVLISKPFAPAQAISALSNQLNTAG